MDKRYIIVAGACLTQFMVIGLLFSYGLFFKVFEEEFGWSRFVLSAAMALSFFMMGVLAMVAGRLNDRFGPKAVLSVSGVIFGVGVALFSLVSEPWHLFVLFGVFVAIGMSTHDVVTLSTVARWFDRKRGLMTAITKVGTAVGQFSIPPLAAWLILGWGWRDAIVVLGIASGLVLLIAALMMKAPPRAASGQGAAAEGTSFAEARRGRIFWTMCLIQAMFFPCLMTIPLHIPVHGTDLGLELDEAAVFLMVMSAASVVGRLAVGTMTDRVSGRVAYLMCFVPLTLSIGSFVLIETVAPLYVALAVYGFAHGGFFTVVSPTVAGYFGLRAHGAIFGVVLFFGTIGGSIGPILAGRIFDVTGSYDLAFTILTCMATLGLLLSLTLPRRT